MSRKRFSRFSALQKLLNSLRGHRDYSFVVKPDYAKGKMRVCLRGLWETDKSEETCYRVNARKLASYASACADEAKYHGRGCSARDAADFLEAEAR
jgi:hypothetical protein